jgi:hypothetical protein
MARPKRSVRKVKESLAENEEDDEVYTVEERRTVQRNAKGKRPRVEEDEDVDFVEEEESSKENKQKGRKKGSKSSKETEDTEITSFFESGRQVLRRITMENQRKESDYFLEWQQPFPFPEENSNLPVRENMLLVGRMCLPQEWKDVNPVTLTRITFSQQKYAKLCCTLPSQYPENRSRSHIFGKSLEVVIGKYTLRVMSRFDEDREPVLEDFRQEISKDSYSTGYFHADVVRKLNLKVNAHSKLIGHPLDVEGIYFNDVVFSTSIEDIALLDGGEDIILHQSRSSLEEARSNMKGLDFVEYYAYKHEALVYIDKDKLYEEFLKGNVRPETMNYIVKYANEIIEMFLQKHFPASAAHCFTKLEGHTTRVALLGINLSLLTPFSHLISSNLFNGLV